MVAGANADPRTVEDLGHVMGVDARQVERHDAASEFRGRAVQLDSGDLARQNLQRVCRQLSFVGADGLHAQAHQIFRGRTHPDLSRDVGRAGFELVGDLVPCRTAQVHLADHVAAGHERRHRLEQTAAGPERSGAGWAEHLVAGEDVEVGSQLLHVDRHMRHGLRAVDEDQRAGGMGHLDHLADRVDRSEHVRDVGEGDELGPQVEEDFVDLELQEPVVGDGDELQVAVLLLDHELPGDQVGVVLHLGQYDRVAPADVVAAPRVGHEVDRFGCVSDEDDFSRLWGVDQARAAGAGRLVGAGRPLREFVDATVDVRAVFAVVAVDGLDHGQGLETRRGRVQIDERLAEAIGRRQDRKVGPDAVWIEASRLGLILRLRGCEIGHSIVPP